MCLPTTSKVIIWWELPLILEMRKPSLRGPVEFAQGFTVNSVSENIRPVADSKTQAQTLGMSTYGDHLRASFTGLLGAWKGIWWIENTVGPHHFPQGSQCVCWGWRLPLSELSKERAPEQGLSRNRNSSGGCWGQAGAQGRRNPGLREKRKKHNWNGLQAMESITQRLKCHKGVEIVVIDLGKCFFHHNYCSPPTWIISLPGEELAPLGVSLAFCALQKFLLTSVQSVNNG